MFELIGQASELIGIAAGFIILGRGYQEHITEMSKPPRVLLSDIIKGEDK